MNLKKLKRLLCVLLSGTMILSTNTAGLASEAAAPAQAEYETGESCDHGDLELEETLTPATDTEAGTGLYRCNICGNTMHGAIEPTAAIDEPDTTESEVAATNVELSADTLDLIIGEKYTLTATLTPPTATTPLTWSVPEGTTAVTLTPNTDGTAIITANAATESAITITVKAGEEADAPSGTCAVSVYEHTHEYQHVQRKDSSCREEGKEAHYKCTAELTTGVPCDRLFFTQGGQAVTAADVKIPKKAHQPEMNLATDSDNCVKYVPEHYYCSNCKRYYKDYEKFIGDDSSDSTCIENQDYWMSKDGLKNKGGHKYKYTFNWDGLSIENFVANAANGVTVTRKCTNAGCKAEETTTKVKVTKTTLPGYNCTQDGYATYTATATFDTNALEENKETAETGTKIVQIPKRDEHAYVITFSWDNIDAKADDNNKLTFDPKGVTATRKCSICETEGDLSETELTVVVDDPDFNPETSTLSCGQEKEINFKATLRAKGSGATLGTASEKIKVSPPAHSLERIAAKAASCDTEGNNAYFECKNCHKKFWDDAPKSSPIDESKTPVKIDPLGHLFLKPEFSWENPDTPIGNAKATFNCGRSGCTAQNIVIHGLTVGTEGTYEQPDGADKTCGEKAFLSYATSVEFDRQAVKKDGTGKYYYDTQHEPMNPITYPGFVKREATINHEFEIKEDGITWADSAANGYYDITKGITAIMGCKNCSAEITFTSTDGTTGTCTAVTGNDKLSKGNITGQMSITKDTAAVGYEEATCSQDGTDIYKAIITCDTHEATEGIQTRYTVEKEFSTKTKQLVHDYVVTSVSWLNNGLDENGAPENVTVTLTCTRGDIVFAGPANTGNGANVTLEFAEITDETADASTADAGNVTKTCMTDGMRVWKVDVKYDSKDVPSASQGKNLYVRKTDKAEGHKYNTNNPEWNWLSYGKPDPYNPEELYELNADLDVDTAEVYAYYPCTNPNCDKQEDTKNGPGEIVTVEEGGKAVEKWARKVVAESVEMVALTGSAKQATCTSDGQIKYHAVAKDTVLSKEIENDKLFFAKATGHKWDSKVIWGDWEKQSSNPSVYKISASVACKNAQCTLGDKKLACTAYTDKRAVPGNPQGCSIQITESIKPATCEVSGWEIYDARAIFVDPYKSTLITFQPGKDISSKTEITAASGHSYVTTWQWKGIAKNADGTEKEVEITEDSIAADKSSVIRYDSATATTKCENEPNAAADVETATINVRYEGGETATCENGVIAYYTANVPSGKTKTESVVIPPLTHIYDWKINCDWDEIDESTVGIQAVYGCLHEIPDDIWTNNPDPEKFVVQDVTVEVDKTQGPDCTNGGEIVWTLKTADGKIAGTHEESAEPVKDAHKIEIDWDTLKATDRDADGKVKFKLQGTQKCEFKSKHPDHEVAVELEATADFGSLDCKTPPQGDVTYKLTVVEIGSQDAPAGADKTIMGGTSQAMPYTAQSHKVYRTEGTPEADANDCTKACYPTHYRCRYCGQAFTNSNMSTMILVSKEPQGHKYGQPVFAWTADGRSANATFTCERCYDEAESAENAEDAKLVYTASVYNDMMNIDEPSKCTAWGAKQNSDTELEKGKGIAYYPVDLIFTEATLPKGLTELKYEGELMARLPLGDHSYNKQGVCEYCNTPQANAVKVIYKTSNGITLREDLYTKDAASIDAPPAAPNQNALKFDGWTVNDQAVASNGLQDAIKGLLKNGGTITAIARYSELSAKAARVTVSCKSKGNMPSNLIPASKTETVDIGKIYTATAEAGPLDANSQKWYFSHWASQQEGGSDITLGYSTEYNVYVQSASPITIYAVYTETKPTQEVIPTVAMTNKYRSNVDGRNKVSFTATMNIPEGYTMVESGILYTTDAEASKDMELGDIGTKVKKSMLNGTKANTFTAKVSNPATVVYARGYLRYKNNATNAEDVVYAEAAVSGSYNSLPDLVLEEEAN